MIGPRRTAARRFGLATLLLLGTPRADAETSAAGAFRLLPGASRAIPRTTSASRDAPVLEIVVAPRPATTLGGEFALLALTPTPGTTLRLGLWGIFAVESRTATRRVFPAPGGDADLWRGAIAYSAALSFDDAGQHWGERGAQELTVSYVHESEHHTASNLPGMGLDHPELRGLPQIGNAFVLDTAMRFPLPDRWKLLGRYQHKLFVNGRHESPPAPFTNAPGADVELRWRRPAHVQPFASLFAEYLFARRQQAAPAYFLRCLSGVVVRADGPWELSVFAVLDAGDGKGLLIGHRETHVGAGLRFAFF